MLKAKYFPITKIFYMENETINKKNIVERASNLIIKKKNFFLIIMLIIVIIMAGFFIFSQYKENLNKKISEKYIKANIFLASDNKEKSKSVYKEIILSKNKFYSSLALNTIIENELESNNDVIINYFNVIEDIKLEKEQKNLVKIKKALFLIKISKKLEAEKILKEIIEEESIWKEAALKILR